jgi:hypothetical protein
VSRSDAAQEIVEPTIEFAACEDAVATRLPRCGEAQLVNMLVDGKDPGRSAAQFRAQFAYNLIDRRLNRSQIDNQYFRVRLATLRNGVVYRRNRR